MRRFKRKSAHHYCRKQVTKKNVRDRAVNRKFGEVKEVSTQVSFIGTQENNFHILFLMPLNAFKVGVQTISKNPNQNAESSAKLTTHRLWVACIELLVENKSQSKANMALF